MESWDVKGVDGAGYVLNSICAAPGCDKVAGERHHLWRRSFLAGDYWWVEVNAEVIGNCVGLCRHHHGQVTRNEVLISYWDDLFWWNDVELRWQPPKHPESLSFTVSDSETPGEKRGHICPSCGQALPHEKHEPEKREKPKLRKSWSIAVPVGEQENGAEVLDVNLEHARQMFAEAGMPYGSAETAKYFVLSTALALFIVNADQILDEGG